VFGSRTTVRFAAVEPTTFLELRGALQVAAVLDGAPVQDWAGNRLALGSLGGEHELVVTAELPYANTGEGMHRFVDPLDGEAYVGAYLGTDLAQRVFACFDQPDLKAPISATVLAPEGWTVLGNGRVSRQGERWVVAETPPISTYLFTVVAGPLHVVRTEHAGLPFWLSARRSLAAALDADAAELFEVTTACFDRYAELFAEPYPFDSYGEAFSPELGWGAMESPGCVLFRDDLVFRSAVTEVERQGRAITVAHEMAHMWFGNLVTMRWWDDTWLSESFADYMGHQVTTDATRFGGPWVDFAAGRKPWGYAADQRPSTHPVAPAPADVADTESALANFDGISYAKGASALRQLVAVLGAAGFGRGVDAFLTRHRFGAATLTDLLDALAETTGFDTRGWATRWLQTTGVDVLRVVRDEDGAALQHTGGRDHTLLVGRLGGAPFPVTVGASDGVVRLPDGAAQEPVLLPNDGDLTYAKVRPDARSWDWLTAHLSELPDPLSRAVVWTSARDRVRDAEAPPSDLLALLRAHLPAEHDVTLAGEVLEHTRGVVVDRYLSPAARPAALGALVEVGRILLRAGSGLDLAAARVLAASVADPAQLRGWLTAGAVAGGPALDADLRWRVLTRLAVLGALTPAEIDAELAADDTGHGPEGAARCRAALPTAEAKDAARALIFGGDASTYLVRAAAAGFWQPEQAALLAAQVPGWFAAAAEVAERRGAAVGTITVRHGFPWHPDLGTVIAAGQACLDAGVPAALHRELADQLDDARRALAVRAAHP
jgi:aminopeptidase N